MLTMPSTRRDKPLKVTNSCIQTDLSLSQFTQLTLKKEEKVVDLDEYDSNHDWIETFSSLSRSNHHVSFPNYFLIDD